MNSPRAVHERDKLLKRGLILDAAQQLWLDNGGTVSRMDELAEKSGVAKGTLYLYFRSKDEVLLALHERDLDLFFEQILQRAAQPEVISIEEMADIFIGSIQQSPTFMPLSAHCHALLEQQLPAEQVLQFQSHISQQIDLVVQAVQPHIPGLDHLLMMQTYGMTLGLWQLLQPSPIQDLQRERGLFLYQQPEFAGLGFTDILRRSLLTLFHNQRLYNRDHPQPDTQDVKDIS